ncbi:MAG: DUF935 family protein [bacterium]|nr:DUF935 family protein [bacterium]
MFDFINPRHWFQKRTSALDDARVRMEQMAQYNALFHLDPDRLVDAITSFNAGDLGQLSRVIRDFEERDDKMATCAMKMRASVGRCDYSILVKEGFENDERAKRHAEILKRFWSTVNVTSRFNMNERGGLRLLKKQMMEAQSYGYAVHEIVWRPLPNGEIAAEFIKLPLWHFENRTGALRFLPTETAVEGVRMAEGEWLVTTGDGVGIPASICAMAKRMCFQDWLLFSERSGMPIIVGSTGATFRSEQWNNIKGAIRNIYRDTRVLLDSGSKIEAIDTGHAANIPFPALVEWSDRAIAALYRGADLSTISKGDGTGASLQGDEAGMIEQDAAANLGETLHEQVDRFVIRYVTGDDEPLASISIEPVNKPDVDTDIKIDNHLGEFGIRLSKNDMLARYGRTEAKDDDDAAERKMSGHELASEPATSGLSLDQLASLIYPLKAAGYTIEKRQLEQATKLKLEETADPNAQPAEPGLPNEQTPATPLQTALQGVAKREEGSGRTTTPESGDAPQRAILAAFAKDTSKAAEAVKALLAEEDPSKLKALSSKLLADLPSLIPEDPALAAVIADAMAAEFGSPAAPAPSGALANEAPEDAWEIVDISAKEDLANAKGICSSPNGVEGCESKTCPGKSASPEDKDADTSKRLVAISGDPSAESVMVPRPEGLETPLRVDPKAAIHIRSRRNQQREKRIAKAKASGDAAALAKAESMMTGEQILEILPGESRKGKVVGRHFDEKQGKEIVDIDTPRLHIAAQKKRPSRKHRQGDKEFGVSTAFPPDEEFSRKTKRGDR